MLGISVMVDRKARNDDSNGVKTLCLEARHSISSEIARKRRQKIENSIFIPKTNSKNKNQSKMTSKNEVLSKSNKQNIKNKSKRVSCTPSSSRNPKVISNENTKLQHPESFPLTKKQIIAKQGNELNKIIQANITHENPLKKSIDESEQDTNVSLEKSNVAENQKILEKLKSYIPSSTYSNYIMGKDNDTLMPSSSIQPKNEFIDFTFTESMHLSEDQQTYSIDLSLPKHKESNYDNSEGLDADAELQHSNCELSCNKFPSNSCLHKSSYQQLQSCQYLNNTAIVNRSLPQQQLHDEVPLNTNNDVPHSIEHNIDEAPNMSEKPGILHNYDMLGTNPSLNLQDLKTNFYKVNFQNDFHQNSHISCNRNMVQQQVMKNDTIPCCQRVNQNFNFHTQMTMAKVYDTEQETPSHYFHRLRQGIQPVPYVLTPPHKLRKPSIQQPLPQLYQSHSLSNPPYILEDTELHGCTSFRKEWLLQGTHAQWKVCDCTNCSAENAKTNCYPMNLNRNHQAYLPQNHLEQNSLTSIQTRLSSEHLHNGNNYCRTIRPMQLNAYMCSPYRRPFFYPLYYSISPQNFPQ